MLDTPVLLIIFNRPETTRKVFEAIRQVKPRQLFVAADGPRSEKEGEREKCEAVRKIINDVDWNCEVKTLFREQNIGCGRGPAEGITWFFEHVEQGIILEDDCLPDYSFFSFCEALLNRYKNHDKIMHIGGNCYYPNNNSASYYFSSYPHIWGWASWRRAWKKYDFNLEEIDEKKLIMQLNKCFLTKAEKTFWFIHYKKVIDIVQKDFWDYQWSLCLWLNEGIAVSPSKNLVKNIGFGKDATHTINPNAPEATLKLNTIDTLVYNDNMVKNKRADYYTSKHVFHIRGRTSTSLQKLKNALRFTFK